MVFNDGMEYPLLESASSLQPTGPAYLELYKHPVATFSSIAVAPPRSLIGNACCTQDQVNDLPAMERNGFPLASAAVSLN